MAFLCMLSNTGKCCSGKSPDKQILEMRTRGQMRFSVLATSLLCLVPRMNYSNEASAVETVYKRPLPKLLISFSSEQGKRLFKGALEEGNMECYFPLSEQFMTQMEPATCGSTTLAMVLNALSLDPKRRWKGIWRWYSEETLEGMKPQYIQEGIDLENFSHITRHNNASIQTFYFPHDHHSVAQKHIDCDSKCPKQKIKSASFSTFKICLTACCRRTGLYMVLNQSRKSLEQTGEGHFQPVGGLNQGKNMALMLDVARFKYPPYWCGLELLYESLQSLDSVTKRPRGFALISRDIDSFSKICSVSADETSKQSFFKRVHKVSFMKNWKNGIRSQPALLEGASEPIKSSEESVHEFLVEMLKEFGGDFNVLLVYNMYEVVDYFDKQGDQADYLLKIFSKHPIYETSARVLAALVEREKHELGILLQEFCGKHAPFVLSLVLLAIPEQLYSKLDNSLYVSAIKGLLDEYKEASEQGMHQNELNLEIHHHLKSIITSFHTNLFFGL